MTLFVCLFNNLRDNLNHIVAICFTFTLQIEFLHSTLQQKLFFGILVSLFFIEVETLGQSCLFPSLLYCLRLSCKVEINYGQSMGDRTISVTVY